MTRATMLLLAAMALAGCSFGRSLPGIHYYTLAITDAPATRLDAPLRVGVITSDQAYATERIAYRSSPYQLDYYSYHRWAADPRNLVRTAARDYFERAGAANGIPFEVEGNIRRLEEVDDPTGWRGTLALDVRVARGGTIILERAFSETEPAASRRPEAVAAALSRALQRILDQLLTEAARAGR
ncbi:MAG: membrane integrity-associated transporter subunit PqiC [Deltaproteobacteria bacterium]|nr:membrane integrity-associated transporter subunit PqiC [Deltaproteobacteria bacterium]